MGNQNAKISLAFSLSIFSFNQKPLVHEFVS